MHGATEHTRSRNLEEGLAALHGIRDLAQGILAKCSFKPLVLYVPLWLKVPLALLVATRCFLLISRFRLAIHLTNTLFLVFYVV